jgi:hypothetical protein
MAVVERRLDAPVDAVASVLADPRTYDGIVVGSRRVRWFDARWPATGTSFHHHVGFGPVAIRDRTTVLSDELPDRLRLAAGLGPLGSADVSFTLTPDGEATRVEMREEGRSGLLDALWSLPLDALTHARNVVALGRLNDLARARHRARNLDGTGSRGAGSGTTGRRRTT